MKVSALARTLDALAEAHGIGARHVARNPALLATAGLEPDDVDPSVIREAEQWHQDEVRRISGKFYKKFSPEGSIIG